MGYPDFPKNRLIVDGADLSETFGMILVDGYTLEPPEPKLYKVDVPGGDGCLDLTEAITGDVLFSNRKQEFEFYVIAPESFEKVKTRVTNFLHGKAYDYKMTMDPDYTYHGRFTVSSYTHEAYSIGKVGIIKIAVDSDPYKFKKPITLFVDNSYGQYLTLESGRKIVQPTFEFSCPSVIIFDKYRYEVVEGSYKFENIWFTSGYNNVYIGRVGFQSAMMYSDMASYTYSTLKSKYRIFEWYKGTDEGSAKKTATFGDYAKAGSNPKTYSQMKKMISRLYLIDDSASYPTYIQYDWRDL